MPRFLLTNAAKNDLIGIARFSEQRWGLQQRNIYLKKIDDMFRQLADNPELGNACDYIIDGYRKFPLASHVIYYQMTDNHIKVIRILHKRMDVSEISFKT